MKIKKLRCRSPEGSSIMTITFIDERSNDYGNKNTWVSSKDVWNNMTLADVDNLPKNSDDIPELPLYKFKSPGDNKKKYNQSVGSILDEDQLCLLEWGDNGELAIINQAPQHRLYKNGNSLEQVIVCENLEVITNNIDFEYPPILGYSWCSFNIMGATTPPNAVYEAELLDLPDLVIGKDYLLSYGIGFNNYTDLYGSGKAYNSVGDVLIADSIDANNYPYNLTIFRPSNQTYKDILKTKIKASMIFLYDDDTTDIFTAEQYSGSDCKYLNDVWFTKITPRRAYTKVSLRIEASNEALSARGATSLSDGLSDVIYNIEYFSVHEFIPSTEIHVKQTGMNLIGNTIKMALGKKCENNKMVTAVDFYNDYKHPTRIIINDEEADITTKLSTATDVHGINIYGPDMNVILNNINIYGPDNKAYMNVVLNNINDPFRNDTITISKMQSGSSIQIILKDGENTQDLASLVTSNLGLFPYKLNHSNIRRYSGLVSNDIHYTHSSLENGSLEQVSGKVNVDGDCGIDYRLIIPAPYLKNYLTLHDIQNGKLPIDHILWLDVPTSKSLFGLNNIPENDIMSFTNETVQVAHLVYKHPYGLFQSSYGLNILAQFLENHTELDLQAYFLLCMDPITITSLFGTYEYINGKSVYTINKREIDEFNRNAQMDIFVSNPPVFREEDDIHVEYELSSEDAATDMKGLQVFVDKGPYVERGTIVSSFSIAVTENDDNWLTILDTNQGSLKPIIELGKTNPYYDYAVVNLNGFSGRDPNLEGTTIKARYVKIGIPNNNMYTRNKSTGVTTALNQKGLYLRGLDVKTDVVVDYTITDNGGATLDGVSITNENLKQILKKSVKDTRHDIKISTDMVIDLGVEKDVLMIAVTLGKYAENDKYEGGYTISVSSDNASYTTILTTSPTNITPEQYLQASKIKPGGAPWDLRCIPVDNGGDTIVYLINSEIW